MSLSTSRFLETCDPHASSATLSGFADVRFNAVGTAVVLPIDNSKNFLRGFIAAGDSYSVHPIDVIDADGDLVGLPTTRGLVPSRYPEFAWQVACRRRLLTVPMAKHELLAWADTNLGV